MTRSMILVLLASCSGHNTPSSNDVDANNPPTTDGGTTDSSADAPPPPPPGHVDVFVTSSFDGKPAAGLRVIFSRTDGTVAADTVTDATGHVSAALEAGYVTTVDSVLPGNQGGTVLQTVLGVHAGDSLRFGFDPAFERSAGTATITRDALPADREVTVFAPCDFSTSAKLDVRPDPRCSADVPLVGVATQIINNKRTPVAFATLSKQDLAAGGTLALPAWQPAADTKLTVTGVPEGISERFGIDAYLVDGGKRVYEQVKFEQDLIFSGRDLSQTWQHPSDFAGQIEMIGGWERLDDFTGQPDPRLGTQTFVLRRPAVATMTTTATSLMARYVRQPFLSLSGTPRLAWTSDGTDTAAVGWWFTSYADTQRSVRWSIVGAAPAANATGVLVLPVLPAPLGPTASDSRGTSHMRVIQLDPGVTYDQLRNQIAHDLADGMEEDAIGGNFTTIYPALFAHAGVTSVLLSQSQ